MSDNIEVTVTHKVTINMDDKWGLNVEGSMDGVSLSFVNNNIEMTIPYAILSELIDALDHMRDVNYVR